MPWRGAERARLHRHVDVVRPHGPAGQVGGLAEEPHHEVVGRLVVELVGAADLLDPALVDHHDLVGDLEGLLLVVGHEDRRGVHLVVQPAQPVAQLLADLRVERAERLVEQQHRRLHRERPGQRHALALAARELRGHPVAELREVHEVEQLGDPLVDLVLRPLADLEAEGDVLGHRHVLEDRVVLEDEAHVALARRQVRGLPALDGHGAGVGLVEPRDDPQQGRLAAAGRAEQGGELPGGQRDGDVVEGDEVTERLGDAGDVDAHIFS